MIRYREGDVFESDWDVLAHGCNIRHVMGAGFAKEVKSRYPAAFSVDGVAHKKAFDVFHNLGNFSVAKVEGSSPEHNQGRYVYNLYTQADFGPGRQVDYLAVQNSLRRMYWDLQENDLTSKDICMPRIGCGLGGGFWPIIEEIIKSELKDCPHVYVYSL